MFASPPRPGKLFLGSGSPCHLLRPSPYIAICSLRVSETGHPTPSGVGASTARQTPRSWRASGPFQGLCRDSLAVGSLRSSCGGTGSRAAVDGRLGGRPQPQPCGTLPWRSPSKQDLVKGGGSPWSWPPEGSRMWQPWALGSLALSRTQAKRRDFWFPTTHPLTRPHGDSRCLLPIPSSVLSEKNVLLMCLNLYVN